MAELEELARKIYEGDYKFARNNLPFDNLPPYEQELFKQSARQVLKARKIFNPSNQ